MLTRRQLTGHEQIDELDDLFRGYLCCDRDLLAVRKLLERAACEQLGPNVLRARWVQTTQPGLRVVFLDDNPDADSAGIAAARALYEQQPSRTPHPK
jgi:hypothetical protein